MSADKSAESTPNALKLICPNCHLPKLSAQAQKFWIWMKKGLHWASVVRDFANQLKLVHGPFGHSNMHSTLDFYTRPARRETNVPLHKKS